MIPDRNTFHERFLKLQKAGLVTDVDLQIILFMTHNVLSDPDFYELPASKEGKHHSYRGGLTVHTYEVLEFSLQAADAVDEIRSQLRQADKYKRLDRVVLSVGAVWHDYGKKHEYRIVNKVPIGAPYKAGDVVRRLPYGHHIIAGAMEFGKMLERSPGLEGTNGAAEHVLHLIESHHGRLEWGSNQEPRTPEALVLHNADMQSVMMNSGDNPAGRKR